MAKQNYKNHIEEELQQLHDDVEALLGKDPNLAAEKAEQLKTKVSDDFPIAVARAEILLMKVHFQQKDQEKAMMHLNNAELIAQEHKLEQILSICASSKGVLYRIAGDYTNALQQYTKALVINNEREKPLEGL